MWGGTTTTPRWSSPFSQGRRGKNIWRKIPYTHASVRYSAGWFVSPTLKNLRSHKRSNCQASFKHNQRYFPVPGIASGSPQILSLHSWCVSAQDNRCNFQLVLWSPPLHTKWHHLVHSISSFCIHMDTWLVG